jgi:hypothetical protein
MEEEIKNRGKYICILGTKCFIIKKINKSCLVRLHQITQVSNQINLLNNSQRDAKSESRDARCLKKQAAVLKYPSIDFTAGSDHRIENVV